MRAIMLSQDVLNEMIQLYEIENFSYQSIADRYGYSKGFIMKKLINAGVSSRTNKTKGNHSKFNARYFQLIDNEENAYWLGFLYGDGWISDSQKHSSAKVGLTLSEKDISHLEKFKKAIDSTHVIYKYRNNYSTYFSKFDSVRILINSDIMVEDLKHYGMIPNKTDKLESPKNIPQHLIRHFIRGFYDADGSITIYKQKSGKYAVGYLTITKTPAVLNFIEKETNIQWTWTQRKKSNSQCKTIRISKQDLTSKFLNYIYKDSTVYLDRKYEQYIKIKI